MKKEDVSFMEVTEVDAWKYSVQKLLRNISQNFKELAVLGSRF